MMMKRLTIIINEKQLQVIIGACNNNIITIYCS